ncbi:DUF2846 domain-containing protein [Salmonella enterica]|nr:DUF2846 domain-containing protein [Salmonella enterica]
MKKMIIALSVLASASVLTGCATVPSASKEETQQAKMFNKPNEGNAGLYIYRDSFIGQALKKDVRVNGECVGELANKFFFYKQLPLGVVTVTSESEFGFTRMTIDAQENKNYFVRQVIVPGVVVGGTNVVEVSEEEGKKTISKSGFKLAKEGHCSEVAN